MCALKCGTCALFIDKKAEKNARPRHNVFVPDKRQMRIDMVVDHRLKTVCVFPITTADMLKPEIQALYDKCVSVGTVFYNGKDKNGELVEQGSVGSTAQINDTNSTNTVQVEHITVNSAQQKCA